MEIVNIENRIAADNRLPLYVLNRMPAEQVTVFYLHQRDYLVLNTQNKHFDFYKKMLLDYLRLDDLQKKELLDYARKKGVTFFDYINAIIRIRRRLNR